MIAENQRGESVAAQNEASAIDEGSESCGMKIADAEKMTEKKLNEASLAGSHVRDSTEYSCPRCGNAYVRLHSLNRHMRFECGVEPRFECPICHKKSKHKHNLILHMRTHQKF